MEKQQLKSQDSPRLAGNFNIGSKVFAQNFAQSDPKWLPGAIVKVTGPLSYHVQLQDGSTVRRHVDDIRRRDSAEQSSVQDQNASPPPDPDEFM